MIGYKALHKNFKTYYKFFKYEIGKTYELPKDEKLKICKCGFHFCANPIDVYAYTFYNPSIADDTPIIVEVEALGDIVQEGTEYATNKIKILREFTREELDKLISDNKHNTGKYNTGKCNSGNYNTGSYNSGNGNSGDCNSGNGNIGNGNTGKLNAGSYNSGSYNTGRYNSGCSNSGLFNSGNFNSGCFNTDEPKMRMFNKTCDMTYNEFLKSLDYDDFIDLCRRIHNNDLLKEDRAKIEALPNYDPDIFTELTGIKFD